MSSFLPATSTANAGAPEVILIDDDNDDLFPAVTKTTSNKKKKENDDDDEEILLVDDDDEVRVLENRCASCDDAGEPPDRPLVRLSGCGHYTHFDCAKKETASHGRTRKRVRADNTSEEAGDAAACPTCDGSLSCLDYARLLSSRRNLVEYVNAKIVPKIKGKSTYVAVAGIMTKWSELSVNNASGKKRGGGRGRRQSSAVAKKGAWAKGTGYGGGTNEGPSPAALQRAKEAQSKLDVEETRYLNELKETLTRAVQESAESGVEIELVGLETELLRRKGASLLHNARHLLVNGSPADVVERIELYSALLAALSLASRSVCLVSVFCFPDPPDEDDEDEDEVKATLLLLLLRFEIMINSVTSEPIMERVVAATKELKASVLERAKGHPHASSAATEIVSSVTTSARKTKTLGEQKARRALMQASATSQEELEKVYNQVMTPLQFRVICLLDLIQMGSASHTYAIRNPGAPMPIITGEPGTVRMPGTMNPMMSYADALMTGILGFGQAAAPSSSSSSKAPASSDAMTSNRARLVRLQHEVVQLKTSLPMAWGSSVFCVVDEARQDVLSFLIIGPPGTPYENGCFVFDVFFPMSYPDKPPHVTIATTGGGRVRFNPNLYANGRVCLSLLGTWQGPGWDAKTSSLLQVIVSIQALIMVDNPMFNEPGYEKLQNTPAGTTQSNEYNASVMCATLQVAMMDQFRNPPYAFKDVILQHFRLKRREIQTQLDKWGEEIGQVAKLGAGRKRQFDAHARDFLGQIDRNIAAFVAGQAQQESNLSRRLVEDLAAASALRNMFQTVENEDEDEDDGDQDYDPDEDDDDDLAASNLMFDGGYEGDFSGGDPQQPPAANKELDNLRK